MRGQISLFRKELMEVADRVENNHFHVKRSTFLGGVDARVHRWFRLTPSFGPDLVRQILAEMDTPPSAVVLDPFAGAGTTLIEAKLAGHTAIGFEINPVLQFVCQQTLKWDHDVALLWSELDQIQGRYHRRKLSSKGKCPDDLGLTPPPIHNVSRWWRPDVLVDLLVLLEAIRSPSGNPEVAPFFELALAGVLVPHLTNVTLGRLQLHFVDRADEEIEVLETFDLHARNMIDDLGLLQKSPQRGTSKVFLTDAASPKLDSDLPPVARVVTSPPYPNRYSYVWNTRPHLYLLGFVTTGKEAALLDMRTIGGTWGSATSILAKGKVEPAFPVVGRVAGPVVEEIRANDNLMANYLMKYFNLLTKQIIEQDRLLAQDAKLAYVVGCSRLRGVYVETDVLLGRIFEGLNLGYRVSKLDRFRKRHSDLDLHESIVYARKT
ncbi:MAG: DNA methyltransferase [Terriglobia bacterium]